MALTQEQWYEKIKTFVPGWWFESEEHQVAYFQGIAKVLATLDTTTDNHITETYICQASDGYLAEHGNERNLKRQTGEFDATFSQRIKNIVNSSSCPSIKTLVDALLEVGTSTIVEDFNGSLYFDRDHYYNRGELMIIAIYNVFSIIVDKQVHAPYSFFDREYFMDREDFMGRQESSEELFNLIIEAVNKAKALGTLYRLVEKVG